MYYEQGKLNEAIQSYQEAIAREPNFPEAYNNLGNALREAGRADEAIACYTMCIQLQFARPQNAQLARTMQANPQMAAMQQSQRLGVAYNNLGGILKMQGRAAEAIACYEHVALLQAESPEAHANLASAYKDAARQDTAIASYKRALQLRPDFPEAFANLVHSLQCICEWQDRQALFVRLEGQSCCMSLITYKHCCTDLWCMHCICRLAYTCNVLHSNCCTQSPHQLLCTKHLIVRL